MTFILLLFHLLGLICMQGGGQVSSQEITTASSGQHHKGYRVVCYFTSWAHYRQEPVRYHPEDVDSSLCTHIIFAFAVLDSTGLQILAGDPGSDVDLYHRLTALKREKPSLKVMLAVGGWNMASAEFTKMVSSQQNMYSFAMNAVEYLHRYDFDGLDVDWEFPGDRGSPPEDKQRFTHLLETVQSEFTRDHRLSGRKRLLLSIAMSPSPYRTEMSYELPQISNYVDFMNLMAYDIHGSWETTVGHHSSLYSATDDESDSIDYMVNWVLNTTVPRDKLNLGLSFYGRTFNLTNPANTHIGDPVTGAGTAGEFTQEAGFMAYYEVCKLLTEHNDTITASGHLPGTNAPYVVDGNRWTGYDDAQSLREKVDYAMQNGLGGVFIWSIDMDDFHGICGGGHYPLMNAIKNQIHQGIIGR